MTSATTSALAQPSATLPAAERLVVPLRQEQRRRVSTHRAREHDDLGREDLREKDPRPRDRERVEELDRPFVVLSREETERRDQPEDQEHDGLAAALAG